MVEQVQETPVSETEIPAVAPETPAPAPEKTPESSEKEPHVKDVAGKDDPAAIPTPYTPNLKFKVMDKEHEFAPYLKDVIKDPKTEKEIRELYEKAYGLDYVKPKYAKRNEEYQSLQTEHKSLVDGVMELREVYNNGDMDGFFNRLKIPFDKVLSYVASKIQYSELPPEQRQQIDAQMEVKRQLLDTQKSKSTIEQQYHEQMVQAKSQMLDFQLSRQDVADFGKQYQEKTGKPFREAVAEYANSVYYTRKDQSGKNVDLTPEQAVKEMMEHYGKFVQPAAAAPVAPTPEAPKIPVIPNVSGRQTSPVTNAPAKSIKEIREAYLKMKNG